MRSRIDVRVDANGDLRTHASRHGDFGERFEFRLGFDVEAADVCVQSQRHFRARLADAGKDDPFARHFGGARASQLPLGDDIHARAEPRQRREHRLVRIGLHRVAHERAAIGESLAEDTEVALDRRGGIAIEGRAHGLGDAREIDVFGVERAVAVGKMMHRRASEQGIEDEGRLRRRDRRDFRVRRRFAIRRGCGFLHRARVRRRLERPASTAPGSAQRQRRHEREREASAATAEPQIPDQNQTPRRPRTL